MRDRVRLMRREIVSISFEIGKKTKNWEAKFENKEKITTSSLQLHCQSRCYLTKQDLELEAKKKAKN